MGSFVKWLLVGAMAVGLGMPAVAKSKGKAKAKAKEKVEETTADEAATKEEVAKEEAAPPPTAKPVLNLGDKAPNFFLKAINAKEIGQRRVVLDKLIKDEATKGVIISFFATWCAPCKKELPVLQKLWTEHEGDGLRIVVISIDKEPEAIAGLVGFIEQFGLTFPVVSDRFNLLARRYLGNTTSLPSVFITDKDGKIQTIHTSYEDDDGAHLRGEISRVMGIGEAPAHEDAKEG